MAVPPVSFAPPQPPSRNMSKMDCAIERLEHRPERDEIEEFKADFADYIRYYNSDDPHPIEPDKLNWAFFTSVHGRLSNMVPIDRILLDYFAIQEDYYRKEYERELLSLASSPHEEDVSDSPEPSEFSSSSDENPSGEGAETREGSSSSSDAGKSLENSVENPSSSHSESEDSGSGEDLSSPSVGRDEDSSDERSAANSSSEHSVGGRLSTPSDSDRMISHHEGMESEGSSSSSEANELPGNPLERLPRPHSEIEDPALTNRNENIRNAASCVIKIVVDGQDELEGIIKSSILFGHMKLENHRDSKKDYELIMRLVEELNAQIAARDEGDASPKTLSLNMVFGLEKNGGLQEAFRTLFEKMFKLEDIRDTFSPEELEMLEERLNPPDQQGPLTGESSRRRTFLLAALSMVALMGSYRCLLKPLYQVTMKKIREMNKPPTEGLPKAG